MSGATSAGRQPDLKDLDFGLNHIPVVYYSESLKDHVLASFSRCEVVGLTHIRLNKGLLMCLCMSLEIIVFDSNHMSHINMLRYLLTDAPNMKFYTTRGTFLTLRLSGDLGIECDYYMKIVDLSALDIFLSMRKCCFNGTLNGQASMRKFIESRELLEHHNRRDLIKLYLGIEMPEVDKEQERLETKILSDDAKSHQAKDIIRKRACLVDVLATKMEDHYDSYLLQDATSLFSFAHKVSYKKYIEYENLDDHSYATVIEYLKRQS